MQKLVWPAELFQTTQWQFTHEVLESEALTNEHSVPTISRVCCRILVLRIDSVNLVRYSLITYTSRQAEHDVGEMFGFEATPKFRGFQLNQEDGTHASASHLTGRL